ncbi:hypothetical protein [Mesorhizobium sp. LjNodule214]
MREHACHGPGLSGRVKHHRDEEDLGLEDIELENWGLQDFREK